MIYDQRLDCESGGCCRPTGGVIDFAWSIDGGLNWWCAHASSTKLGIRGVGELGYRRKREAQLAITLWRKKGRPSTKVVVDAKYR